MAEGGLKRNLLWQAYLARALDQASKMARTKIYGRLERLLEEANAMGKNLAVSPMESCHDDRPTITGRYSKFKFEYVFLSPDETCPEGWQIYEVADPRLLPKVGG